MNVLILEPPYSHLFKSLNRRLKPSKSFVHLFNIGYLIYLPDIPFILIKKRLKKVTPSKDSIETVKAIKSLANSNIKSPAEEDLSLMARYFEYLETFIKENDITHILCHNDLRWQHAIAREVARKMSIKIYFSEEGLFRPHTLTFDDKGVNAFSSVPRNPDFYKNSKFTESTSFKKLHRNQFRRAMRLVYFVSFMLLNKLGDLLNLNVPLKNKNYSLGQYLKLFYSKLRKSKSSVNKINLQSRKFIFIPLQVSTDTQTIIHSDFRSTQEVIDKIESAYARLSLEIRNEYALVFKKHPMESHISYKFQNFSLVSNESTGSLLERSSLVVLVNSTTIVEALLKGKKIIALGNSHYDVPGLLIKAKINNISESIQRALTSNDPLDKDLVNSFLNYLKFHYQVNGNIFYYDNDTVKKLSSKLHD